MVSLSFAWGESGHKIVAQIASDLLSNEASSIVQEFIGSETLADIAPLPDDYDHTAQVIFCVTLTLKGKMECTLPLC